MKIGLRFLWPSTSNFQSDHFESITIHFNYSLSLFKLGNYICSELKSVFFFQAARNWKTLKFIASEIVSAYSLSINRCWFVYSSSSIELERKLLYFLFKQLKIKTSYFLEWWNAFSLRIKAPYELGMRVKKASFSLIMIELEFVWWNDVGKSWLWFNSNKNF